MKESSIVFDDSVAQNYDDCLGPFLFEPFALDLVERIEISKARNVLELACGTGRVTKHLSLQLSADAKLTATDLNPGMIDVAKQRITSGNVRWETVDMTNIPFEENQFDLIVCQFGIMFAPDKVKAFTEIRRVLKKGGKLIFNTWGDIHNNKVWSITSDLVNSFLGENPTGIFTEGPFSLQDEKVVLQFLEQAGFNETKFFSVDKTGTIPTAAEAAKGFILGLPVRATIKNRIPSALPEILTSLEKAFTQQLSDLPLKASLNALVFECTK